MQTTIPECVFTIFPKRFFPLSGRRVKIEENFEILPIKIFVCFKRNRKNIVMMRNVSSIGIYLLQDERVKFKRKCNLDY